MARQAPKGRTSTIDDSPNELGIVICKICARLIGTLPTEGYKKFYGVCADERCRNANRKENGHGS